MTLSRWFSNRIALSIKYRGVPFTMLWCVMYVLGLAQTWRFSRYRARQFDRRYGLDTAQIIDPSQLGLSAADAEQSIEYEPCAPELVAGALSSLPIPLRDYVFVDLGSGKGAAVLSASLFPFKRIVGIEWSKRVAGIARENVRKFAHPGQACRSIELLEGDATAYELPPEPLVLFLYNPFREPLVRRTVDNLRRSLERSPRHVVVVYCHPMFRQAFDEAGFLRQVETPGNRALIATYESRPSRPS
jgi:hypothetical protein